MRTDPDGSVTVTLLVEDPADPVASDYTYESASSTGSGGPADAGVFAHPWPSAPQVVTFGLYSNANGQRIRVPLLLTENLPPDWMAGVEALLNQELSPIEANSTPFVLDSVDPSTVLWSAAYASLGSLVGAPMTSPDLYSNFNQYPADIGYQDLPPIYYWSTFRTAPGQQLWQGVVVTHNGTYATDALGDHLACSETRAGAVMRNDSGTTFLGGVFVSETAQSTDTLSSPGTYDAEETITSGTTTEAAGTWTDVPGVEVEQDETKSGQVQYVYSPDQQTDTVALGVDANGTFVPLLGTKASTTNGAPPDAEDRIISLGAYSPLGSYVPVLGLRTHFTEMPSGQWFFDSTQLSEGPGEQNLGDWQADLGVFDPLGNFVPLLGARYNQELPNALHPYQMLVTAGPWVAAGEVGRAGGPSLAGDTYVPVVGASYDGAEPLENWVSANGNDQFAAMGPWLAAAGAISPTGTYVPLVGASYAPGPATSSTPVIEEYRVGTFTGSYPAFVPVVGAQWSGQQTSLSWSAQFATSGGLVPTTASVNVGPTTPDGALVSSTQITATPGNPDTYGVGIWAQDTFVPLLTVASPGDGLFCGFAGRGSATGSTTAFGGPNDPPNTSGTFSFTASPQSLSCQAFVRRGLYEVTSPFTVTGSYVDAAGGAGSATGSFVAFGQSGEVPNSGSVPAEIDCNFTISFAGSVSDAAAGPPQSTAINNGLMLGDCQVYIYSPLATGGYVKPPTPSLANVMIGGYVNAMPTDPSGDFQIAGAFGGVGGVSDEYPFLLGSGFPPF